MAKENSNDPNIKYQNLLKEELKNEIKAKLKPKRYQFLYFVIIFSLLFVLPGYLVNTYGYDSFEVYLFWLVIYLIFLIIHAFSYLFCMLTLAIVYFRTKYRSYLYEFTLYLTSLTIPALGLFHFHPGSEVAINAFVMIIIISAGPLLGQSLINKPIIVFNSKYCAALTAEKFSSLTLAEISLIVLKSLIEISNLFFSNPTKLKSLFI